MLLRAARPYPRPRSRLKRSPVGSVSLRLLVAVALLATTVACSRPVAEDDGVRIEMRVTPQPPAMGTARIELQLRDHQGQPLPASAVELEATMTHPGMTPSFAIARTEGQPTEQRWLADVELTMSGDWVVIVDARLTDGRTIERTLPLPGVVPR